MSSLAATPPRSPAEAPPTSARRSSGPALWLVIGLPAALALGLSLWQIGARSIGFDEAASVTIASQHGNALWRVIAHDGGNMAGYYLMLHGVIVVLGNGLVAVRLLCALAAAAAAGLTAALAGRLFDLRVGAIAGALTAVSLPLIYWGQTARGYAPMVALALASMLAFVALAEPRASAPRRAWWVVYALSTAAAIYSSFVAVLIVPAQLLLLARRSGARVRVLSALAAAAALCVPLLLLALTRGAGQLFWVPRPTLKVEHQVLETLTSAGLRPTFPATVTAPALLVLSLVLIIGVAIVRRGWGARLMLSWLIVPLVLAWLESMVGQSIFVPRNLLAALPAASVLLALAVTDPRLPRRVAVPLLLVVLGLRAHQLIASYGATPEDWKGTTAYVLARARADDCVVFYPQDARMPFDYYVQRSDASLNAAQAALLPILPPAPWSAGPPYVETYGTLSAAQLAALPSRCARVWLVWSHAGQPNGPAASLRNLAQLVRLRARLGRIYTPGRVASFGYAARIYVQSFTRRRR